MPNFRPVERHLKFLAVDFEDHPSLRDSGAGVRQSAVQQRARPVHAAKPKEGAGAVEVVLPGAQHREADEGEVCGMRKGAERNDLLGMADARAETGQLPSELTENGGHV